VADLFACPANTSKDLISCLRTRDGYMLYDAESSIKFTPVVENEVGEGDEAFLTDFPKNILRSKDLELVPWMVGLTTSDGALFTATFPQFNQPDLPEELDFKLEDSFLITTLISDPEDKSLAKEVAEKIEEFYFRDKSNNVAIFTSATALITDLFFLTWTNSAARLHTKRGATVYYYWFDYHGNNSFISLLIDSEFGLGPVHLDDVLYLFPQNHVLPHLKFTPQDEDMVETMTSLWVNFARTGNPAKNWNPVSSPDVLDYVRITQNGLKPGQGIFKERSEFLETLPFITRYTTLDKDEL